MNELPPPTRHWTDGVWVSETEADQQVEDLPMPAVDRGVMLAVTEFDDPKDADETADRLADAAFDTRYGDRTAPLERERELLQTRLGVAEPALGKTDRELGGQPSQIEAAQQNGGVDGPSEPMREVPPWKWQLLDLSTSGLILCAITGLSAASYLGIQATFESAKLPIFLEFPHLSWMLAMLVPCAGLAVKLAGNVFTDPANRDRYRKGLVIVGIGAFVLWVPMLGALYEGVSNTFDPLAEPNHLLGWAFTVTHILAEVCIAGGLFAQLDAIWQKWTPSRKVDNPAIPPLERIQTKQLQTVAALNTRLGAVEGDLARLYGVRESLRILVRAAIRQRMNEKPRDGLL